MAKAVTCTRRLQFCAGHRVHKHEGKCRALHGHNYVGYFTAQAKSVGQMEGKHLDILGRVIDFGVLKERIGGYIDEFIDHGFIVWIEDQEVIEALKLVLNQKVYMISENPTAENIAKHLLDDICPKIFEDSPIEIIGIVLEETENCFAEANNAEARAT